MRLGIENYQFPDIINDEWDSNWLIVVGDVVLDGRPWRFRDPCLTTFEVSHLANWLELTVAGRAEQAFCTFTEPVIDFERQSDQVVRIAFSLEAVPPWIAPDGDLFEVGFDVPIDERLTIAANALRELLTRFPIRAS